jgi:hypothetical protein
MEDLIHDWDLIDVNPTRGRFTWSNRRHRTSHISSLLERFLINKNYLEMVVEPPPTSSLGVVMITA